MTGLAGCESDAMSAADAQSLHNRNFEPSRSNSPFLSTPNSPEALGEPSVAQDVSFSSLAAGTVGGQDESGSDPAGSISRITAVKASSNSLSKLFQSHNIAGPRLQSRSKVNESIVVGSWRGALPENGGIGLGNQSLIQCVEAFLANIPLLCPGKANF